MFKVSIQTQGMGSFSDEDLFIFMKNREGHPEDARNAWNEFYKRYSAYMWSCCLKHCRSASEGDTLAKDIFQTTMEKIYLQAGKFDPVKNTGIKSWMGRIAQNEFNDYFKKYNSKFSSIEETDKEPEYEEYSEEEENDISEVLLSLKREQLQKLLMVLNEKEIKILMTCMTYFQLDNPTGHLPDVEMQKLCLEFGIKSPTVRQIKKRALDKLKKAVKDLG